MTSGREMFPSNTSLVPQLLDCLFRVAICHSGKQLVSKMWITAGICISGSGGSGSRNSSNGGNSGFHRFCCVISSRGHREGVVTVMVVMMVEEMVVAVVLSIALTPAAVVTVLLQNVMPYNC